jgi:hypothetical protein
MVDATFNSVCATRLGGVRLAVVLAINARESFCRYCGLSVDLLSCPDSSGIDEGGDSLLEVTGTVDITISH